MAITLAKTKAGMVSGVEIPGKDITVFKGVPFAAPPVGDLRWKRPQPVEPWEGVRKADAFTPVPWQAPHKKGSFYDVEWGNEPFECSEDCLYVNIWTPAKSADEKLPVAVWIYGGGFMSGFAHEREFDGEAFASKNVIYVSINYRLHVFGYLAHPELDKESGRSGNYGLYDQIAAVTWVHENIDAFGGDPENIMVFGQSAGAGSTISLFCSPLMKGVMHKAVVHSGLGGFMEKDFAYDIGQQFVKHCGYESPLDMRDIPAEQLMEFYKSFKPQFARDARSRLAWGPYIDGVALTEPYDVCVENGDYNDIQLMMGSTKDDMAGGAPLPWMPPAINAGMRNLLLKNEEHGRKPGYLYFFSRPLPGDDSGSWHSSDLWYVHGTLARCWRPFEEYDYKLSDTMVTYWTNFCKNGDPNGEGLPEWQPFTRDNDFTMVFGDGTIGQGVPEFNPNPDPNAARWQVADDPYV
ncbi:MAG: carboxylesterase family protein [Oscillospiraceae bacterium]|nr:carboxylesterase family protein [Oscillospiraceae bacterium]